MFLLFMHAVSEEDTQECTFLMSVSIWSYETSRFRAFYDIYGH